MTTDDYQLILKYCALLRLMVRAMPFELLNDEHWIEWNKLEERLLLFEHEIEETYLNGQR